MRAFLIIPAVFVISACNEIGHNANSPTFGAATQTNDLAQYASLQEGRYLNDGIVRFANEAPDTVRFAFNRADLTRVARRALDEQAAWLRDNPDFRVSVTGHTDLVGGETYNDKLGQRRAQVVARYLLARGIEADRVEAIESRGETDPAVDVEGRAAENRRTVTSVAGFTHGFIGDAGDGARARLVYGRYASDSVEEPEEADSTAGGS